MKRRRAKMDNSSVKHGAPFCREPIEPGSMAAIKYISCYFQKQRDRQNDDGHIKGCHIIQCGGNRGKEQKEKKNIQHRTPALVVQVLLSFLQLGLHLFF